MDFEIVPIGIMLEWQTACKRDSSNQWGHVMDYITGYKEGVRDWSCSLGKGKMLIQLHFLWSVALHRQAMADTIRSRN